MSNRKQALGRWGEAKAAGYLEAKGYKILERNYRNEHGEIDLVARDGEDIVFVEVKTRSNADFGFPEEAVDAEKQAHLVGTAEGYLQDRTDNAVDWRVDVIAILRREDGQAEIRHFEHALR